MSAARAGQEGSFGHPGRAPGHSALSPVRLIFAFAAVLLVVVIAAALAIVVFSPKTPLPECMPGQICGGPPASPPPIGGEASMPPAPGGPSPTAGAPTPTAGAPTPTAPTTAAPTGPAPSPTAVSTGALPTGAETPAPTPPESTPGPAPSPAATQPPSDGLPQPVVGDPASPALRTWPSYTDPTWGHTIHHQPFLAPQQLDSGGVVLAAGILTHDLEVAVRFDAAPASVTPEALRDQLVDGYRGRISSLASDDSPLTRVHRPSIGQIPAIASGYRGDLGTSGSVSPVALVVMAATDGRITVAVSAIVTNPDTVIPGTQLRWFRASGEVIDPMLKRFEWGDGS